MRKTLLLLLVSLLALAIGYMAWPAWAAWELRAAVKTRDVAGIERRVDWPTLRANLKQTIAANLSQEGKGENTGLTGLMKRTLGPFVAGKVIDVAVTPETLARVLAGRMLAGEVIPITPAREGEATAEDVDPLSPRRLRWAFLESPTRFRVEVADPRQPDKRIVSIFALQGLSWKLVDVYYRSLA
jgi:hypothetical protein